MPTNDPTQHGPWGIYDQPALAASDKTRERVAAVLCRVMDHGDHPFGCPESLDAAPELIAAAVDAAPVSVETDAHHSVTITFEEGYPSYRFTCTAPADALCRADWSCDCEKYYDEQVRNGVPAHRPHWGDPDTWHAGVFKTDFCGIKAWFDGSSENPLDGEVTVPVEAEWDGEYYAFTVYTPATPERSAPVTVDGLRNVLAGHRASGALFGSPRCGCGRRFDTMSGHERHQAEVLATVLDPADPRAHAEVGDPAGYEPGTHCMAFDSQDYCCTRTEGHPGQHIAENGRTVVAVWDREATS